VRAVSNAGPNIHLSWVDRLDLLEALFQEVLVPAAVRDEILPARRDVRGVPAIRSAFTSDQLKVRAVTDRGAVAGLESYLHRGEAEAIVLMRETAADLLLLDDKGPSGNKVGKCVQVSYAGQYEGARGNQRPLRPHRGNAG
jgi:predicted nucleic acid-binding protein